MDGDLQDPPIEAGSVDLVVLSQALHHAEEPAKAVEIWQSVIERYPRSRVRFTAHMLLGKHFLERERAYDRARVQLGNGLAGWVASSDLEVI